MIHGKRQAGAVLTALVLSFAASVSASAAEPSPTPSASQSARVATSMVYKSAVANRAITMMAINDAFTKAVKRAKKELSAALAKATTPALKSAAAAKFKDAIDKASAARQAALDSLPALPPLPTGKTTTK